MHTRKSSEITANQRDFQKLVILQAFRLSSSLVMFHISTSVFHSSNEPLLHSPHFDVLVRWVVYLWFYL